MAPRTSRSSAFYWITGLFVIAAAVLAAWLAGAQVPTAHKYGAYSLLPPIVAITLAMVTHRILTSLLIGVFVGAFLEVWVPAGDVDVLSAVTATAETFIWTQFADTDHLRVLCFTMLMGAMVGVLYRSGGMHGLVEVLSPLAKTRRRGMLTTWLLGLVIFFDDYANTVLLGHTMRPLTDRLKISREKLAYLVDSTAAPVAGLAIVSTWVAFEVSYIDQGFANVGAQADAYGIFLKTIPYRFYVLGALAFVFLVSVLGRDFGPMLAAEQDAAKGPQAFKETGASEEIISPEDHLPRRWYNAVVPVVVVVLAVMGILGWTGWQGAQSEGIAEPSLWEILGQSDSYQGLFYGSIAGIVSAILLVRWQKLLDLRQIGDSLWAGGKLMIPSLAVLILAWALSAVTGKEHLDTGTYLSEQLQHVLQPEWLPTLVFVLAAGVSFATGTSWGTMAIVVPESISVTYHLLSQSGVENPVEHPLMLATIGGVLAGAIFGDHCSPISDTTVLSSQSAGCDHLAHVGTQLGYALAVGAISIACGTLPVAYGLPVGWSLALGASVLVALLLLFGKDAETRDEG